VASEVDNEPSEYAQTSYGTAMTLPEEYFVETVTINSL
jgi:hypothetical protein